MHIALVELWEYTCYRKRNNGKGITRATNRAWFLSSSLYVRLSMSPSFIYMVLNATVSRHNADRED
jgi:hypothetical protein